MLGKFLQANSVIYIYILTINSFQIENMKEGKYRVIALKDKNSNYLFNPLEDKIDFACEQCARWTQLISDLRIL